jgi:tRNA threonylcarbamoyladenosine biosynthesis protein TsaB
MDPEVAVSDATPRLLILETSGRVGMVALAEGADLLQCRPLDEARRHARDLAPAISELLAEQRWEANDLAAVIVSRGPGSYTGLRVGMMSAKTFAYATRCALLGVDTFAAIALQSPPECSDVDVIADAQKDQIYVQPFTRTESGWKATNEIRICSFLDWLGERPPDTWVSGPGLVKWRPKLEMVSRCVAEEDQDPQVDSLLELGLARYLANERDDIFALEPLYLRASSAEEQWKGRPKS